MRVYLMIWTPLLAFVGVMGPPAFGAKRLTS
jgi:hypothetical protein